MMRIGQTRTSGKRKPAYRRRKPSSTAVELDCAMAFQKIARDCTAKIMAHHSSACAVDAEAVHQIRVAITRLRAAVSFFAPMTVDAEWLRLKKEMAWLNGSLGAARDTDVALDYAGRARYRVWAQGRIGQDLDERRLRDHRRLVRCLRSLRFQRLIEALSDWIGRGPWVARWKKAALRKPTEPLRSHSKHKLDRWHKRLIRKGRRIETMDPSGRHRLRIKAKRLRYMLEVLTDIVRYPSMANSVECTGRQSDCSACWETFAIWSASAAWAPYRRRRKTASRAIVGRRAIDGKRKSCLRLRSQPIAASSRPARANVAPDSTGFGVRAFDATAPPQALARVRFRRV
jgi:CHAD domain-containing protein